jgi:hypothetical protein
VTSISRGQKIIEGSKGREDYTSGSASQKRRNGAKVQQVMKENNNQMALLEVDSNQRNHHYATKG